MRRWCFGLAALALVGAGTARADVVTLVDGRELRGKTSCEGDRLVVTSRYGETSFPKSFVATIKTDEEIQKEEAQERAREEKTDRTALELTLKSLGGATPDLPADQALVWEKDPKAAAKLASDSNKILLTFVVVGDLGTGHC